ncbi:MAG: topoisomerase, partial [Mogibacterium sp.]|nr:topoisomerase [Mogibacterium sp.]
MPYYTEEQIRQARTIDLLTYLQMYEPTELIHIRGNTYCTREHDSLKISNGKWYWWSRGFGGNSALDYLIKVKGLQFLDAMAVLTENYLDIQLKTPQNFNKGNHCTERKLLLPERSETNLEVI